MATEKGESVSDEENSAENKEQDPSLDFFSEEFDPLKALRTPGVVPPVINATTYDNISKYERVRIYNANIQQVSVAGTSKSVPTETIERRWLPHQCKF